MILAVYLKPSETTLVLATPTGDLVASEEARWRVGSGQSIATHLATLLAAAHTPIERLTRIALIDEGGSFTGARVAYAFARSLAWSRGVPVVALVPARPSSLPSLLRASARVRPVDQPLLPRY